MGYPSSEPFGLITDSELDEHLLSLAMKTLIILLLFAICGFAWQSEPIMQALGLSMPHSGKSAPLSIETLTSADSGMSKGMSVHEYAELAKKDPHAYQKFIQSHQQNEERSELDKLMNFFARGKYE